MTVNFPKNLWCRYADDGVVHCRSKKEAYYIKSCLEERFAVLSLELHSKKTKIIYCKDSNRRGTHEHIQFTFLGYTFKPRKAKARNGQSFTSFLPAISNKAKQHIMQTVKNWHLRWMTRKELHHLAEAFNPIIRGWLNYYGKYGRKDLARVLETINYHLVAWVRRKYKRFKFKKTRASKYLQKVATNQNNLFAHWQAGVLPTIG